MVNLKGYPYPLIKLYNKIEEQETFFSRFFCFVDFFNATIKYLNFIISNQYNNLDLNYYKNKTTTDLLKELNYFHQKGLIKEIFSLEIEKIKKLTKLNNYLKKAIDNNHIDEKEYKIVFFKASNSFIEIINTISLLNKFTLLIPYQIKKKKKEIQYINLSLKKPKLVKEYFNNKDLYINNFYLKIDKKIDNSLDISIKAFYNYFDTKDYGFNKKFQEEVNNFLEFITGSKIFKLSFSFKELDLLDFKVKENLFERILEIEAIEKFFSTDTSGFLFLVGPLGIGKTSLLNNYQKLVKQKEHDLSDGKISFLSDKWTNKYITTEKNFYTINISEKNANNFSFSNIITYFNNKENTTFSNDKNGATALLMYLSKKTKKQVIIIENLNLISSFENLNLFLPEKIPDNIYFIFSMSSREIFPLPNLRNKQIHYISHFSKAETMKLYQLKTNNIPRINEDLVSNIIKNSYGIPLYINYFIYKEYKEETIQANNIKKELLRKFRVFIDNVNKIVLEHNKNLLDYNLYIFAIITINNEGFNKKELTELFFEFSDELIDKIIDISGDFILKINGRYKLINRIYEEYIISLLKEEKLIFLHNKIIAFFEPWEKKISSLNLKNLPEHYFYAKRIDELKHLLQTNFLRSKFKLYPNEVLKDLELLLGELRNNPFGLLDFIKFIFIYQNLKEESKNELYKIQDICLNKNPNFLIDKFSIINKPENKSLQLFLASYLYSEKKYNAENRIIIKEILETPETFIDKASSQVILRLCSEILLNESIEIINFPKTKEEGVILIKYLKENYNSQKLIDIFIKLTEIITSEEDKAYISEALINKVSSFKNNITLENFFSKILVFIDKNISNKYIDRLLYVYSQNFIQHSFLYSKFFDKLVLKKDIIQNPLYKFMFYINIAIIFVNIKQDKIAIDYINSAINQIIDFNKLDMSDNNNAQIVNSINHIIKNISYFNDLISYNEILEKIFLLIEKN
ncbi:MAG: hypothetical protein U0457_15390 [Candidatus Sericytochromatia bacterium]